MTDTAAFINPEKEPPKDLEGAHVHSLEPLRAVDEEGKDVPVATAVPVSTHTQRHHGQWAVDLCGCWSDYSTCCFVLWLPCVPMARAVSRSQLFSGLKYWKIIAILVAVFVVGQFTKVMEHQWRITHGGNANGFHRHHHHHHHWAPPPHDVGMYHPPWSPTHDREDRYGPPPEATDSESNDLVLDEPQVPEVAASMTTEAVQDEARDENLDPLALSADAEGSPEASSGRSAPVQDHSEHATLRESHSHHPFWAHPHGAQEDWGWDHADEVDDEALRRALLCFKAGNYTGAMAELRAAEHLPPYPAWLIIACVINGLLGCGVWAFSVLVRRRLVAKYALNESPVTSCLQVTCCGPCTLGQQTMHVDLVEYGEVQKGCSIQEHHPRVTGVQQC